MSVLEIISPCAMEVFGSPGDLDLDLSLFLSLTLTLTLAYCGYVPGNCASRDDDVRRAGSSALSC